MTHVVHQVHLPTKSRILLLLGQHVLTGRHTGDVASAVLGIGRVSNILFLDTLRIERGGFVGNHGAGLCVELPL